MRRLEYYRRALRRTLNDAEAELGFLQSTAHELLGASPERVQELGEDAFRLAQRVERRGRVLRGRSLALASEIDADGPAFDQLAARLEPATSEELNSIIGTLRERGQVLGSARQRFRDSLQLGQTVARMMLRSIVDDSPTARRACGLATSSRIGVLNRKA